MCKSILEIDLEYLKIKVVFGQNSIPPI